MPAYDTDDEPPLDPAAERLRRRLVRLLLVSGAIMVLGFIAVFAAIVHKLGIWDRAGEAPGANLIVPPALSADGTPVEATIRLPAGSRVIATDLDGSRALLTVAAADGASTLLLVDLATGTVTGRYALQPQ